MTPNEYKRIIARSYLYTAEVGIDDLSILTVCAVTSGKPVKVLSKVHQLVRFSPVAEALYKSNDKLPFYVLVVAELAIEERNYSLLLFSKGKKRKAFLRELVRKGAMEYLRLAYQLYPDDVMEVFSMSKDFPTLEENIRVIVNDLGAEKIAQAITAEQKESLLRALLEQLGTEKVESILHNDGNKRARG